MRTLYDNAYLSSGCTIPFDESTNLDNTTWSWATSYALAGVSFMSAALVFKQQRSKALLMILYLSFTGIGNTVAGASQQFGTSANDWQYYVLSGVAVGIVLFANALFMRTGILFFFYDLSLIANLLWLAINGGIFATTFIFDSQQAHVAGLALTVTYFAMCMLYGWVICGWEKIPGKRWAMFLKILAMWTNIAALVEQFILSETCGRAGGYENCFKECPLSDPVVFNHNALFHILLIAGICLLTIGELKLPTHSLWDYYGGDDDVSEWETRKSYEEP